MPRPKVCITNTDGILLMFLHTYIRLLNTRQIYLFSEKFYKRRLVASKKPLQNTYLSLFYTIILLKN